MPQDVEAYANQHCSPLEPLLQEVLDFTEKHHPKAHMISGAVQGTLLQQLSHMLQPKRILEIGTFTGFSALCLAAGMPEDGLLYSIEMRTEDAATAQSFFNRSVRKNQLRLLQGDARQIIPTLQESWDLVFIDADKVSYIEYYEMLIPRMASGSFLLADNVLFHGEVLQDELKGKNAKAIAAFNSHVQADDRTENVLLTVRDGLMLIRKK